MGASEEAGPGVGVGEGDETAGNSWYRSALWKPSVALGKSLVCDWVPKTPACDSHTPTRVSRWGGSLVFNLLGLCPSIFCFQASHIPVLGHPVGYPGQVDPWVWGSTSYQVGSVYETLIVI